MHAATVTNPILGSSHGTAAGSIKALTLFKGTAVTLLVTDTSVDASAALRIFQGLRKAEAQFDDNGESKISFAPISGDLRFFVCAANARGTKRFDEAMLVVTRETCAIVNFEMTRSTLDQWVVTATTDDGRSIRMLNAQEVILGVGKPVWEVVETPSVAVAA